MGKKKPITHNYTIPHNLNLSAQVVISDDGYLILPWTTVPTRWTEDIRCKISGIIHSAESKASAVDNIMAMLNEEFPTIMTEYRIIAKVA